MKCKCGHELFKIEVNSTCEDCEYNGAYDKDNKLTYDDEEIEKMELTRSEVEDNGSCKFGTAYGPGCWLFTCAKCGHIEYLPLIAD